MKIVIGSRNQIKIRAVRAAIGEISEFDDADIFAIEVNSNVPQQPLTLEETTQGAMNRALNAFQNGCDYSIGLEYGLIEFPLIKTSYMNISVCAIYDGKNYFIGLGPGFEMPENVTRFVIEECLDVDEASYRAGLIQDKRLGHSEGLIGILSNDYFNREQHHAKPAVQMALAFLLYQKKSFLHSLNP